MQQDQHVRIWELPFDVPAELELLADWGWVTLVPVEPGRPPRLELSHDPVDSTQVHLDKVGSVVRLELGRTHPFGWLGGWECRATLYVPPAVRASVQTSAGSISVRDLSGCELGIKADAGKIDLARVHGFMHLAADAGSIRGQAVGGHFEVEAQAGSVRLEIDDLQPGTHRVRAAMGSVRLALARGLDVCIETRSSLGSVRNGYPSRPDAAARLSVSTEMGSVRIEETDLPVVRARPTPPPASSAPDQREETELDRILKMVEAGELSPSDADELLQALDRV